MIDKHSYQHVFQKVVPKSFSYKFLNSGDPLYLKDAHSNQIEMFCFALQASLSKVRPEKKLVVNRIKYALEIRRFLCEKITFQPSHLPSPSSSPQKTKPDQN